MGYAYKIAGGGAVYFVTCTVNKWVDTFSAKAYSDIIIDSLDYCVENKG
jgi:putative transposase